MQNLSSFSMVINLLYFLFDFIMRKLKNIPLVEMVLWFKFWCLDFPFHPHESKFTDQIRFVRIFDDNLQTKRNRVKRQVRLLFFVFNFRSLKFEYRMFTFEFKFWPGDVNKCSRRRKWKVRIGRVALFWLLWLLWDLDLIDYQKTW